MSTSRSPTWSITATCRAPSPTPRTAAAARAPPSIRTPPEEPRMDAQQVDRYRRDGVLFPVPALDPAEVARCRAALEAAEPRLADPRRTPMPHTAFRWAWDLATHPAVLDAVEAVLGPELLIQATMVLTKPPGDPALVTWHQDGTYSGLHLTPNTTAWIALWDS